MLVKNGVELDQWQPEARAKIQPPGSLEKFVLEEKTEEDRVLMVLHMLCQGLLEGGTAVGAGVRTLWTLD